MSASWLKLERRGEALCSTFGWCRERDFWLRAVLPDRELFLDLLKELWSSGGMRS